MKLLSLAVFVACCCAFAACGGQDPDAVDSAATDAGLDDGEPVELAMADDVLRLALERPDSYLPGQVSLTDQSAVIVADLLYDGLTEAVGVEEQLRPGLAQAWWHNEDYTEWTFLLDPDTDIGAETVVATLLHFASDRSGAGGYAGVAARLAAGIQSVSAADDRTVLVVLDGPNAGLPWVLSGLPFSIVGPGGEPTGEYRIGSDDAAGLRLVPRQGRAGLLRPVRVEWEQNRDDGYQRLKDGTLDGALVPAGSVDVADDERFVGLDASVSTRFYVLHLGSDVLSEPAVRSAVGIAIDRETLASNLDHDVVATDGLMPPSMIGYRAGACGECADNTGLETEQPLAVEALGPIEVAYAEQGQRGTVTEIVAQLTAAGLSAVERRMEPEELATVIVNGETDIFSFGWVAASTSSDAILPVLLSADSPANVARIGSSEIDRLLAAAAVTADDRTRWDLHHQAHRAALSSGRLIPVAASRTSLLLSRDAGVTVRADGSIDLERQT